MKGQVFTRLGFLLLLLFMGLSCTKSEDSGIEPVSTTDRVIFVYMGGDNNLSNETTQKIEALKAGWSKVNSGKLLIFRDYRGVGGELLEIYKDASGQPQCKVIETYGQINSADPEIFAGALNEMFSNYKAASYGLIVFSHATGWLPQGALSNPYMIKADTKSIFRDGTEEMEIMDFVSAIPDHTFDFIIFEACLMAGIEVLYELRNKTDYVVASAAEIFSPGFEPYYSEVLYALYKEQADLRTFVHTAYSGMSKSSLPWATFSVVRTAPLEDLAAYIKQNDYRLHENLLDTREVQHFKPDVPYRIFFDFEDAYSCVTDNETEQSGLEQRLNACIMYAAATETFMYDHFPITKHSGITTYIEQEDFPYLNQYYKDLGWYRATH